MYEPVYECVEKSDGSWYLRLPIEAQILRYRDERVAAIVAEVPPVVLVGGPRVVLHILPEAALGAGDTLGLATLTGEKGGLRPLNASGCDGDFNFDGYRTFSWGSERSAVESYLQLYRDGSIETVAARLIAPAETPRERMIPGLYFEQAILECVGQYFKSVGVLNVQPPFHLLLSLLGVLGYGMAVENAYQRGRENKVIDRDRLLLPALRIDDLTVEPTLALKPLFDRVWQAAGWSKSVYYNDDGSRRR